MTPKHLICLNEENTLQFLVKYDKVYNDDELTPFLEDKVYNFAEGVVTKIEYNHDYQKIFAYTQIGNFIKILNNKF
jgi:hypothetical protein